MKKDAVSWKLAHPKFRLSVWVQAKEETFYPTLYTIDTVNKCISFEHFGHTYVEPLTHVNMKAK
jgi:hypothetical protein